MSDIVPFLTGYLVQVPLYAVWIVGFVVAMNRWHRHPTASRRAVLAIGILFLNSLVMTAVYRLFPYLVGNLNWSAVSWLYGGLGIASKCVEAGAWVLLLAAIFGARREQQPYPFDGDRDERPEDRRGGREADPSDTGIRKAPDRWGE
jgi:hypothetical protein